MSGYDFMGVVNKLGTVASGLDGIEFAEFLAQLDNTESLAPLFAAPGMDASAGVERIATIREFATAAQRFKTAADMYRTKMGRSIEKPKELPAAGGA